MDGWMKRKAESTWSGWMGEGMKALTSVLCRARSQRRIFPRAVSGWRRRRSAMRTRSCLPNSLWPSPHRPRVSWSILQSHHTHTSHTHHTLNLSLSLSPSLNTASKGKRCPLLCACASVCVSAETLLGVLGQTGMWKRWLSSQCREQHQDRHWV